MSPKPSAKLVTRAIEVAEQHIGMERLALRLGVHPFNVRSWRDGTGIIPDDKFLALIDVLTELVPDWEKP